jgi:hypothetical protein
MIQERPKLKPPLKPAPARDGHVNRPRLLKDFVVKPTAPVPPSGSSQPPTRRDRVYFCRFCGRQSTGFLPPAWLCVERGVVAGSLPVPEGLSERDGKHFAKRTTMRLGIFCSWKCLALAAPRLEQLVRELNERGVGLRRLEPGEAPPAMPACVQKGGQE